MARPISEAQRQACQQNAKHSTGPRTAAGKSQARLNAVKHGLTAKLPVLPFEDPAEFQALKQGFLQDFAPQTTYQTFLVTQLATHAWRILRSQQVEIGLHEVLLKKVIHDLHRQGHDTQKALAQNPYAGLALTLEPTDPRNHLLLNFFRYTRQIQADFERTRKALTPPSFTNPNRQGGDPPPANPNRQGGDLPGVPPLNPTKSTTPRFVSSNTAHSHSTQPPESPYCSPLPQKEVVP